MSVSSSLTIPLFSSSSTASSSSSSSPSVPFSSSSSSLFVLPTSSLPDFIFPDEELESVIGVENIDDEDDDDEDERIVIVGDAPDLRGEDGDDEEEDDDDEDEDIEEVEEEVEDTWQSAEGALMDAIWAMDDVEVHHQIDAFDGDDAVDKDTIDEDVDGFLRVLES